MLLVTAAKSAEHTNTKWITTCQKMGLCDRGVSLGILDRTSSKLNVAFEQKDRRNGYNGE